MKKRVLIGGPLRQDEATFREHLKSIDALNTDGIELDRFWIVNDCDEVISLLKENEYTVYNTGDEYIKTERTHEWSEDNMNKMCTLRNMMIQKALDGGYDYLFFVDSDLILQPETLQQLIEDDKDCVAEIFWTKSEPDLPYVWTNCWLFDQCGVTPEAYQLWANYKGCYQVGGTGACFLIKRNVLEAGVNYSTIYNIKHILKGEDRWFCIRAACHGFDLFIDTNYPARHLFRQSELKEYLEEKYGTTR